MGLVQRRHFVASQRWSLGPLPSPEFLIELCAIDSLINIALILASLALVRTPWGLAKVRSAQVVGIHRPFKLHALILASLALVHTP